jgi:hypothetical protein
MGKTKGYLLIGAVLVALSALVYALQIRVFQRTEDTFYYMFQDIAFVPIYVLLVTVIIDGILTRREKQALMGKMNMVIGTFFSEAGNDLLKTLSGYDLNREPFIAVLLGDGRDWSDRKFQAVKKYLDSHDFQMDTAGRDLEQLKALLTGKREGLLRLLENPNLLEHDTFTDLLWAVTHLTEELAYREDVTNLSGSDRKHLEGDIRRVYVLLIEEWLAYIRHLRDKYPYIFHLVTRTNPFDRSAMVEVQ